MWWRVGVESEGRGVGYREVSACERLMGRWRKRSMLNFQKTFGLFFYNCCVEHIIRDSFNS